MRREQQITQASQGRFPEWGEQQHALELAFQAGAIWADAHSYWISVEDELPKEDGTYLFYDAESQGAFVSYFWADLTLNENISHWMRIKKPKAE